MSIDECIDAYLLLPNRMTPGDNKGTTAREGRFISVERARAVNEAINGQRLHEDALLRDAPEAVCKVDLIICLKLTILIDSCLLPRAASRCWRSDLSNSVKI